MMTRARRFTAIGAIAVILLIAFPMLRETANHAFATTAAAPTERLQAHPAEHRQPSIDGAVHPELFSDEQALSMFMLTAADSDPRAGRSYVNHIFNAGQHQYTRLTPAVIEAIRTMSVGYTSELRALYRSGKPNVQPEMATLTETYETRLIELLGAGGAQQLSNILTVRIKPKLRSFSKP